MNVNMRQAMNISSRTSPPFWPARNASHTSPTIDQRRDRQLETTAKQPSYLLRTSLHTRKVHEAPHLRGILLHLSHQQPFAMPNDQSNKGEMPCEKPAVRSYAHNSIMDDFTSTLLIPHFWSTGDIVLFALLHVAGRLFTPLIVAFCVILTVLSLVIYPFPYYLDSNWPTTG